MIGLFLNAEVAKQLDEINPQRIKMGLKPLEVRDWFDMSLKGKITAEGDEWFKAVNKHILKESQLEFKAAQAAAKTIPKGTFAGIVDDVAKTIGAPAAAVGVALEKLRTRKNKVAVETAATNPVPNAAAANAAVKNLGKSAPQIYAGKVKDIAKGQFGKGMLGISAAGAGIGSYANMYNDAAAKVDSEQTFPPLENKPFQYPVGASPVGMGMSPLAGVAPDMRREAAISREIFSNPKFYADTAFGTVDSLTMGALTRNQEYNRLSGLDGNLSIGEQLGNFAESVGAIPLDILSAGAYDAATIGPEFSPVYTGVPVLAKKVSNYLKSDEEKDKAAAERMKKRSQNKTDNPA